MGVDNMGFEHLLLQREVEDFLYAEAELIDSRRFEEWLNVLTEDFRIHMPMTRNVRHDQSASEKTREKADMNWFDEGKETLRQRVQQIATGLHWAEEPRSRTVHMITNVRLVDAPPEEAGSRSVTVASAIMVYRNRGLDETDYMVGRRKDVLVKTAAEGWKVRRREVDLAQTVLLSKNLTTFF